ncbi:TPA: tetratricopeptide repeat protein [Candidatus Poribacteria bacterium]|nr:tetratricopeptide repeat protein [Candidatus Poribacteria bacterium]
MSRKNAVFLILLACLIIGCEDLPNRINRGNRYYNLRRYDFALQQYESAVQKFPESDIAHYDLGNALYKSGKFTQAAEEYRRALATENRVLRQKAYYNLGNTYLQLGDLKYAIDSYKNALELNHRDFDAKYNLEFALEQLKKRQLQQEYQSGPSSNKVKGQAGQSNRDKLSQTEKPPAKKSGESLEKQGRQSETELNKMSEEDVMRMLEALRGDEKNLQVLQLLRRIPKKRVQVEKDW